MITTRVHEAHVRTEAGADVLERIFQAIAEGGLVLRELRREEARLEDVFANLTTEEAAHEAEAAKEEGDEHEEAAEAEEEEAAEPAEEEEK